MRSWFTRTWIAVAMIQWSINCTDPYDNRLKLVQVQPHQAWQCSFDEDDCGIVNQRGMPINFTLFVNKKLFSQTGVYLLNMSNCKTSGARLITPYFDVVPSTGYLCLQLVYLTFGNALHQLSVTQQDYRNQIVWYRNFRTIKSGSWNTADIEVQVEPGTIPRFFVEAKLNRYHPQRSGFLALSNLSIKGWHC